MLKSLSIFDTSTQLNHSLQMPDIRHTIQVCWCLHSILLCPKRRPDGSSVLHVATMQNCRMPFPWMMNDLAPLCGLHRCQQLLLDIANNMHANKRNEIRRCNPEIWAPSIWGWSIEVKHTVHLGNLLLFCCSFCICSLNYLLVEINWVWRLKIIAHA